MYNFRPPFLPMFPKNSPKHFQQPYNNFNMNQTVSSFQTFQAKAEETETISSPTANKTPSESPIWEIMGIKIYFDDLLIICILLFLYQEGIQDQYLFISLILLLLS